MNTSSEKTMRITILVLSLTALFGLALLSVGHRDVNTGHIYITTPQVFGHSFSNK